VSDGTLFSIPGEWEIEYCLIRRLASIRCSSDNAGIPAGKQAPGLSLIIISLSSCSLSRQPCPWRTQRMPGTKEARCCCLRTAFASVLLAFGITCLSRSSARATILSQLSQGYAIPFASISRPWCPLGDCEGAWRLYRRAAYDSRMAPYLETLAAARSVLLHDNSCFPHGSVLNNLLGKKMNTARGADWKNKNNDKKVSTET
jgi:hypothetical protein